MSYTVDYSKTPETLVRELFNYDNETDYTNTQLQVVRDPVPSDKDGFEVDITLLNITGDFHFNDVSVSLNRIQLDLLFSQCGLELREFDVSDDQGIRPSLVRAAIQAKYGLYMSAQDYVILNNGNDWALKAADDNPAFAGLMPIDMTLSLATRVQTVQLDGFQPWDPNDIAWAISKRELSVADDEITDVSTGVNFARVTKNLDFTMKRDLLELDGNGRFKRYDELMALFAEWGVPAIPPETTANDYETSFLPDAYPAYDRIVRTQPLDNETGWGRLYLHYNETDY